MILCLTGRRPLGKRLQRQLKIPPLPRIPYLRKNSHQPPRCRHPQFSQSRISFLLSTSVNPRQITYDEERRASPPSSSCPSTSTPPVQTASGIPPPDGHAIHRRVKPGATSSRPAYIVLQRNISPVGRSGRISRRTSKQKPPFFARDSAL